MSPGRVCAIHNEYCPDGRCRWCEAPASDRIAYNISANNALLQKLKSRSRIVHVPGGDVPLVEMSYAEAGMHQPAAEPDWTTLPSGGVTGSPF